MEKSADDVIGRASEAWGYRNGWDIGVWSEETGRFYTFEIKVTELPEGGPIEVTKIRGEAFTALRGLAKALVQMDLMPESSVDSELKATKYHLEDMRNLNQKMMEKI